MFGKSVHAAAQELARDEFIEFGDDDPELQSGRVMGAFTKFHQTCDLVFVQT
jgi:hypothetical protein